MRRIAITAVALATTLGLGAAACSSDGSEAADPATDTTVTAVAEELPSGAPGPGCEEGWSTPEPGTDDATLPLELIVGQMGIEGELDVVEVRMFAGPEVPWILEPRPDHVDWWYVKATLADDPSFAGRWLVARRDEDRKGIDAVAPFDTTGFASPDWRAFEGDGVPREIEGLPGAWPGLEYDFVTGDSGSQPGLPVEAAACLDGT